MFSFLTKIPILFAGVLALFVSQSKAQCLTHIPNDTLCENSSSLLPVQLLGPSFASSDSFIYTLNGQAVSGNAIYNWQDTGNYQLIVTGINTQTQASCTDTGNFFVVPASVNDFELISQDTQCFDGNQICIRNIGSIWKVDDQNNKYDILWGAGTIQTMHNLKQGDTICFSYPIIGTGDFNPHIRLTDQRGCVSDKFMAPIHLKGVHHEMFTVKRSWCGPLQYGGGDFSINFDSSLIDSSKWSLDGFVFEKQALAFTNTLEFSGVHTLTLTIFTKDGCPQSYSKIINGKQPLIQTDKGDTLFILDANVHFSTGKADSVTYFWNFDDPQSGPNNVSNRDSAKHFFTGPGKYSVTVQSMSPGCAKSISKDLFVTGPLARINAPGYNVIGQCFPADTVRLSQSSLYYFNDANPNDDDLTGGKRHDNVIGIWDFGDFNAPACTTDTKNGINTITNCRYSLDSAAKHFYSNAGNYTVSYAATDTVLMHGSRDSIHLQLGAPKLDDWSITKDCAPMPNSFYLRWNEISKRPQSTFRILLDSAADRNDGTPNAFDQWLDEGQTRFDATIPNPMIKITGEAVHQVYFNTADRMPYHPDGYVTIGLHLFNGDTSGSPCDTIIWLHHAYKKNLPNFVLSSTINHYTGTDSISWQLNDLKLHDINELSFILGEVIALDNDYYSWGRTDRIIRDVSIGNNRYDYLLREEFLGNDIISTDSIVLRHYSNNVLISQDWRDTTIELPSNSWIPSSRILTAFSSTTYCPVTTYQYITNGFLSAINPQYPEPDSLIFTGDSLGLDAVLYYLYEEPDPLTGQIYDHHPFWSDPQHYGNGSNRPIPPGGYETLEWKINGQTLSSATSAWFVPADTGWYTISLHSTDSAGRTQVNSMEIPVFGIRSQIGLLPDTSAPGPGIDPGEPQVQFNNDLDGIIINRNCEYFIQFEEQSSILDPCIGRYGTPCLPEVKVGIQYQQDPVVYFKDQTIIELPFELLNPNTYTLYYQVGNARAITHDTLVDLDINIQYTLSDSTICNDEAIRIDNLSSGLGADAQFMVYPGANAIPFGTGTQFTYSDLNRGNYPIYVDAYPGSFLPGGIFCPVRTHLGNLSVQGAQTVTITGNTAGSPGSIQFYTADIGFMGLGNYQWNIVNGNLLSSSNLDTISAVFNGDGNIQVLYSEGACPANGDTLNFITSGINKLQSSSHPIYPNPSKGKLAFKGMEGSATISVYDARGAKVLQKEIRLEQFELSELKAGVYFIQIDELQRTLYRLVLED